MGKRGVLFSLLLAIVACGENDAAVVPPEPPIPVTTSEVLREEIVEPIRGTGTIAAHKTTDVSPRVDGIIEEIFVRVGDRVDKGAQLFRTRLVDYEIRAEQQAAAVKLARAELDKARRDLKRAKDLKTVVSRQKLDDAMTADSIARARLEQAQASLKDAQQAVEDTLVRAPFSGTITRRYVDEGAFMRTMMSSASPVVQIMKTDIVAAIVHVPEIHLPRIRIGTPARVRIDGLDREYDSEVYIMNDRIEHMSHAVELRLPIRNDDLSIKPGLFAKAVLFPEGHPVMVVGRPVVLGPPSSRHVFVEHEGHAVRRAVEVRDLDAGRLEVVDGLSAGELVLAGPNLRRVRDGAPVVLQGPDVAL